MKKNSNKLKTFARDVQMFYKEKLAVKIGVNVILVAVVLVTGIALGGAFHKDEVVKE